MDRRTFIKLAAAMGATAAFSDLFAEPSKIRWQERRDFFPEGVASADPDDSSVLLWTRYGKPGSVANCDFRVELSENESFSRVIARANTRVSAASDWTCRVLVGGLKPRTVCNCPYVHNVMPIRDVVETLDPTLVVESKAAGIIFDEYTSVYSGWPEMILD